MALFDNIAAALPSAESAWIWKAFASAGVSRWLVRAAQCAYAGTTARVLFCCRVFAQLRICIRRGIKQQGPASGTIEASLFDAMVRRLSSALGGLGNTPMCYADDLAASMFDYAAGVRRLMP